MVTSDTGLPDPDNPNNEVSPTNDIILVTDDEEDSDDRETVELDEYQPLAMDEDSTAEVNNQSNSDDEAREYQIVGNTNPSTNSTIPPITPMEEVLVKEVWSAPPPKAMDIEMDSKKVDEVKEAMMNITLPPSSIPEWASNISEEEWKCQLMKRLQHMQEGRK